MQRLPLLALLLSCAGLASPPAPVNVRMTSDNFQHVLRWDPGPGTPTGTRYNISKTKAGRKAWKLSFKSTNETSCRLRLENKEQYSFYVQALHNQTLSPKSNLVTFKPFRDTTIGPPELSLSGHGTYIHVNISLPKADKLSKIDDIQKFFDPKFIVLWRKENGKVHEFETHKKSFPIKDLEEGVEYWVQVDMKIRSNRHTKPSAWCRVWTSPQKQTRVPVFVGVVSILLVFIIIILIMGSFTCCRLKTSVPRSLMIVLGKNNILTPKRLIPDQISIGSENGKKDKRKDPRTSGPYNTSGEEDNSDDESDTGNLYLGRDEGRSLSESSYRESGSLCEQSKMAKDSEDVPVVSLAETERLEPESDHEDTKAEGAQTCFRNSSGLQSPLRGDEAGGLKEESLVWDVSGNVNLFSVTLVSLSVGNEAGEEAKRHTEDFSLGLLSQTSSQRELDDPPSAELTDQTHEDTEAPCADRCAETWLLTDEEEDFSDYLGHR
ncbi:uncharacterized protein ACNS7B_024296 isoform 1-T1 [Menidia menidia]